MPFYCIQDGTLKGANYRFTCSKTALCHERNGTWFVAKRHFAPYDSKSLRPPPAEIFADDGPEQKSHDGFRLFLRLITLFPFKMRMIIKDGSLHNVGCDALSGCD